MNISTRYRCDRSGVTLVELLAVCAIIAILATMAFPAISGAIARSRLTLCSNNMSQLGYATLRHDELFGYIPGCLNQLNQTGTLCTWAVPMLTFIGRNDMYDDIVDRGIPASAEISTFVCPEQSRSGTASQSVIHYSANIGVTGSNPYDGPFLEPARSSLQVVSLSAIADADGTATTLAFAETAALYVSPPHRWTYFTGTGGSAQLSLFGAPADPPSALPPVFGIGQPAPTTPIKTVINIKDYSKFSPSSVHRGGAVVTFCDGHTVFMMDKLESHVYAQLLTPKTRWVKNGAIWTSPLNSSVMTTWLLKNGEPYVLDAKDLRP